MSNAIETQGTELKRGDGATPEVFTSVGEVTTFSGPGGSASVIDVTHLLSTAKEKRMGLPDEGQFTFEVNLVPSDVAQTGLRSDRAARTLRNFELVLTDVSTTTLSFAAYVTGFALSGSVDNVTKASITLEITGAVTWA